MVYKINRHYGAEHLTSMRLYMYTENCTLTAMCKKYYSDNMFMSKEHPNLRIGQYYLYSGKYIPYRYIPDRYFCFCLIKQLKLVSLSRHDPYGIGVNDNGTMGYRQGKWGYCFWSKSKNIVASNPLSIATRTVIIVIILCAVTPINSLIEP